MATIQFEADVSSEQLLNAAEQLPAPELDRLAEGVRMLQARRRVSSLPEREADLLLTINRGPDEQVQERFDELMRRRQASQLTPAEYQELLRLTDELEESWANRMTAAAELANLRGVPLAELLSELGIPTAQGERLLL